MNKRVSHLKRIVRENISRPEILFLIIAVPACLFFASRTPFSWGLDEQVHIARAYQVSQGNMYPDKLAGYHAYGGEIPVSLDKVLNNGSHDAKRVDSTLPFYSPDRKDIKDVSNTARLNAQPINDVKKKLDVFGQTGAYSPVVYLPSAAGILVGRILNTSVGSTLLLARLFQALFYVLVVFGALRIIGKNKASWVIFIIALLPMSVFQAVTVNADTYTNASILLFIAVIVRLFDKDELINRREEAALYLASVGLMFTKPSYALALILVAFLPQKLFTTKKKSYLIKSAVVAGGLLLFVIVSIIGVRYSGAVATFDSVKNAQISSTRQISYMFHHPIGFIDTLYHCIIDFFSYWTNSAVGNLGMNFVATPYPLVLLSEFALGVAMFYCANSRRTRQNIMFILVGLASAVSVITLLYITYNEVGSNQILGIQGRYFVPCLPFLILGIGGLLHIELKMKKQYAAMLFSISMAIVLYGSVYVYAKALY